MSISVIHFNDKITNVGGVEVYLSQLQPLLNAQGYKSSWLEVRRAKKSNYVVRTDNQQTAFTFTPTDLKHFLEKITKGTRCIYHLHSVSDPALLETLFSYGPVIRTMHEPRLFCPGQGKFWRADEVPCPTPAGIHCIYHAYAKQCCNRHPKRLIKSLANTYYELKNAGKRYSAIIANSNWISNQAILAGVPEQKIKVIPYYTEKVEPTAIPENLPPKVLFIGRLTKEKGLHYLLLVLKKSLDKKLVLQLDIVGDGHERFFFEEMAQRLGLSQFCTFHGWLGREKIKERINAANVVAFPSIYPEAFGIVGIEAMMHARPVVAFDVGGVQEWLQDKITGFVVEPKNCDDFSTALIKICLDYEYASWLGKNAYLAALKRFLPEHHLIALKNVYNQILA